MKRERLLRICGLAAYSVLLGSPLALGQSDQDSNEPEPEAMVSGQLREALSLDPVTLAALSIDSLAAYGIAFDGIADALVREETLLSLAELAREARSACAIAEGQEGFDAVRIELAAAIADLVANKGNWSDGHVEGFGQNELAALSNAASNIILESPIRLLALSVGQRDALWEAQVRRDQVLLHPGTCRRGHWTRAAVDEYWLAVEQTLTQEQLNQLENYYIALEANLPEILLGESDAYGDSRHGALPGSRPHLAKILSPRVRELYASVSEWIRRTGAVPDRWWRKAGAVPLGFWQHDVGPVSLREDGVGAGSQ